METFVDPQRYVNGVYHNIYQVDITILFIKLINNMNQDYMYLVYDNFLNDVVDVLNKVFEIDFTNVKIVLNIYYKGLKQFVHTLLKYYPKDVEIKELVKMYKILEIVEIVRCPYTYQTKTKINFYQKQKFFKNFKSPDTNKVDKLKNNLKEFIKNNKKLELKK